MKRRALLGATTAAVAGLAGCLKSRNDTGENAGGDEYTWTHEIPGWGLTVSNGIVFGREKYPSADGENSQSDIGSEIAGGIFALNAETGEHQWTYGSTHPAYDSYTSLIVEDGVFASKTDDVSASWTSAVEFDGTERWSDVDGEVRHVTDGVAYLVEESEDATVRAIDAAGGDELWTYPGASIEFDAAAADTPEIAYVAGEDVVALDTDDGSVRQRYEHGDERSRVEGVFDGVAYTSNDFESVVAVADGEEQWRTGLLSYPNVHDVISGHVLVQTDSHAFAFDATTGEKQWVQASDGVHIRDDRVYVSDRGVSVLELESGTELWSTDVGDEQVESMNVVTGNRMTSDPSLFVQTDSGLYQIDMDGEVLQTWTPGETIHDFAVDRFVIISTDSGIYAL